jgi:hypothetical protein
MRGTIFGFILGVSTATVGFSGLAPILDSGVRTIQQTTINTVQKSQEQQIKNYDLQYSASPERIENRMAAQ